MCVVRVWDDWVEGVDQGDEAARWFAQCLQMVGQACIALGVGRSLKAYGVGS